MEVATALQMVQLQNIPSTQATIMRHGKKLLLVHGLKTKGKTVTFKEPVKAKYIKLLAVESVRDFATAAEIRLTGTRVYNDTTAPVAPTATATDVTDTTAKISWVPAEADKDIVEYQLMNGDKEIATFDATETSFTVADLKAATEYTLSVYALDEAGNKSDAGNVTFTTKATEEHTHTWGEWTVTKNLLVQHLVKKAEPANAARQRQEKSKLPDILGAIGKQQKNQQQMQKV